MLDLLSEKLLNYFESIGFETSVAIYMKLFVMLLALVVLSTLLFYGGQFFVNRVITSISKSTKTKWDDILLERKVFKNLPHLLPAIALIAFSDVIFGDFPLLKPYVRKLTDVFIVFLIISVVFSFMNAIRDILKESEAFKDKPINSYIQLVKIIAAIFGAVMAISFLIGTSPFAIFTAMGALTAIIILIFKDTILGFVASIQLASNDMIRVGDWVTLDAFNADGDVIDITLNTIKIRNFDKTISTVPTYAFVTNSFKNWRGMTESRGRRIKRAVFVKINSVKFLTDESLDYLKQIDILKDYLDSRIEEVNNYNSKLSNKSSLPLNGRHLTNLGTFRAYLKNYLDGHEQINHDMTCMVRQLSPTPNGIPIELYAFTKDKRWEAYERIMSDMFDHVLASAKYFELELFENPSGTDFQTAFLSDA